MAGRTAKINACVEPELKKQVEGILDELGVSTTDAIRLYFQQIVHSHGIPFNAHMPNDETRKAMYDARNEKDLKSYDTTEEYFKSNKI